MIAHKRSGLHRSRASTPYKSSPGNFGQLIALSLDRFNCPERSRLLIEPATRHFPRRVIQSARYLASSNEDIGDDDGDDDDDDDDDDDNCSIPANGWDVEHRPRS